MEMLKKFQLQKMEKLKFYIDEKLLIEFLYSFIKILMGILSLLFQISNQILIIYLKNMKIINIEDTFA
jgi:hypothetical protein